MAGDRSLIAHLFRRAAFGARPTELEYYSQKGYSVAVEDLLAGRLTSDQPVTQLPDLNQSLNLTQALNLNQTLDTAAGIVDNASSRVVVPSLTKIQSAWVQRMVTTTAPLVERMTLFLHNHFATAYRPGQNIDTPELEAQNRLFRSYALGDWRALCHAMIEDVALSNWLNNNVNVKEIPNENLAREYMELFTLGTGNYAEADVREAARALTGYVMASNVDPTAPRNQMKFVPKRHDAGMKTILGQTGNFMPQDFVNIVLSQRAAPRFVARKLAQTFVVPEPSNDFVDRIADALVANDWHLSSALRFIFLSPEFTAPEARSAIVKSPAEFMIGALRSLSLASGNDFSAAVYWLSQAGQMLYNPPNVGGWPRNMGWLGAGGILARYNAGMVFADRHMNSTRAPDQARLRSMSPGELGEIFGITELAPSTVDAIEGYVRSSTKSSDLIVDAAMITLLLASPDYLLA